ncbi:hypothetical protein GGR54DRAFT_635681 [Hypoxylon sp. NC1633]|nr:hypothetical protein GGR54DRAFT_635681 [Hypoxylon sp. NC1633]
MSLLGLPVEILRYIIEESVPEGFESLMLSCRVVYECGNYLINTHNTRKRAWNFIGLNRSRSRAYGLALLYRISNEPILARYKIYQEGQLLLDGRTPPTAT